MYSGVTFLVEPGLRHVVKLGFKRVIVFPYFRFQGAGQPHPPAQRARCRRSPRSGILQAGYLGDHPGDRHLHRTVAEVVRGDTAMNCSLCKYRQQVLGFETEGRAAARHHHHVEGLNEPCQLCENECTGACQPDGVPLPHGGHGHSHDHGHHHPIYPHADHPLGPRTMQAKSEEKPSI